MLVLDLDETLLHSYKQYPGKPAKVVPVNSITLSAVHNLPQRSKQEVSLVCST